jgi:hypothetical protein
VVDSVINNTGVIEANSVGVKNGMIVLGAATAADKGPAAPKQTVKVSGTLSAAGQKSGEKGGTIQVTGEDIALIGAKLDASGQAGGGTVLVGGDTGGGRLNPAVSGVAQAKLQPSPVATASTVSVDAATVIDASAKVAGDGGKVVVWSNVATNFAGTIYATGGPNGGNGGFAEVSSHGVLTYTGLADLSAPKGTAGTLLLDPANVVICDDCDGGTIDSADLSANLNKSNMVVTTDQPGEGLGNITVRDAVVWNSGNSLTLSATANIYVNANLTSTGGGAIKLRADNTGSGTGTVMFGGHYVDDELVPAMVSTSGRVTIFYNPTGNDNTSVNATSYTSPTDYSSHVTGGGTLTAYMLVNTVFDLQNIQNNLGGSYALGRDIDASATAVWNGGQGFVPIGQMGHAFTGRFNGEGQHIDGLTIAPTDPNVTNIGLFGVNAGVIRNVELTNVSISANPFANVPTQYVGALAGQNFGTIGHVAVTGGTINGGTVAGVAAGGLVGQNGVKWITSEDAPATAVPGVIRRSTAAVTVTVGDGCSGTCDTGGTNYAGGLVGINGGIVSRSAASGSVISGSNSFAGGLVGQNANFSSAPPVALNIGSPPSPTFAPVIANSYATGDVTSAGTNVSLGGLVGMNGIALGPATITHGIQVGVNGPVASDGPPAASGVILNSYAGGHVSATANLDTNCNGGGCMAVSVGGLVGQNTGLIQGPVPSDHTDAVVAGGVVHDVVTCGAGATCASGMVSAGAGGQVGGLVGNNQGIIDYAFATGTVHVGANGTAGGLVGYNAGTLYKTLATGDVTGDAGIGTSHDGSNKTTSLGGLVGQNFGVIDHSYAHGAVGSLDVDNLEVGGLVGFNSGTITYSFAKGDVSARNNSSAGGLVGDNQRDDSSCDTCNMGIGQNNDALISNSGARGNVTVGAASIAGGFAATNRGTIASSHTRSNVTGGHDSILGGFVGVGDFKTSDNFSVITGSTASGTVNGLGANIIAAGFAAVNAGQISASLASGGVNAAANSYLGGFVGINIGSVTGSSNTGVVNGAANGTGSGNIAGGFVGVNFGLIDSSTTTGQVSSGANSIVGGFAGGNLTFANVPSPNPIPATGSTFPVGTITNSSIVAVPASPHVMANDAVQPDAAASGSLPFTGSTGTGGYPGLPSLVTSCNAGICQLLVAGLQPPPPPPPPPSNNNITVIATKANLPPVNNQIPPPPPPSPNNPNINLTLSLPVGPTGPIGGYGGNGNGGNGGNGGLKPNYGPPPGPGLGRTPDEQQYSGVPPPNETRFKAGEVVIQVVDTVPVAEVVQIAQGFGLVLISTQHLDQTHRNVFRFRTTGNANIRKLIAALEKKSQFASVGPNYMFIPAQNAPAPAAPAQAAPAGPADTDHTDSIPPANEAAPDLANSDTASLQSLPAGDAAQYVIEKFHLGAVHHLASGRNVLIAVIDSEIDAAHPDLRGVIAERFDATQSPSKPHPHGTGMAGAIASRTRLLGVAPGARILAIKAFDESATSAEATSFQILKGLDYAIAKNVRIINMSFAGPRDPMMERTLKSAHDKGIILIAAAGNAGPKSPPLYPGADVSVIAVTASDYADKPFAMANRGKYIAVGAPGVDVMVPAPANSYQLTTGTSVAAAHVSGVAALLVERKPNITPDEVRAILMRTATAFSSRPKGEEDGAGLVDPVGALKALTAAKTSEAVPSTGGLRASVH